MKSVLQQSFYNRRNNNSFRNPLDSPSSHHDKSQTSNLFWLVIHGICCIISLVLGFRFSRIIFFLLFSTSTTNNNDLYSLRTSTTTSDLDATTKFHVNSSTQLFNNGKTNSRVVVGRHGILIREWPHPDYNEVMRAHKILDRVQREQRIQYGIKNPRTLIVITPTYVRTFQRLHVTGLMHSLMLVPYDLIWIVVEAGGRTNETSEIINKSGLRNYHVDFDTRLPISWEDRHKMEAKMRIHGLRVVREEKLDGIVMFGDDSNMHNMELFDEIQSVQWFGAISVGILAHSSSSIDTSSLTNKEKEENLPMPVQGPACNSSGHLIGWHTFNSLPYEGKSARYIGDREIVLPRKLEWSGFVLNSRLVWKESPDRPVWVNDLDSLNEAVVESPLSLLTDPSYVEPLGDCGRKVMLWWLRVEARVDSKFPSGWIIDPPLEITVPAKRTPWPDAPPELPSNENLSIIQDRTDKRPTKTSRATKKHSSRIKRKRESQTGDVQVSEGQR
ncbi:probable beta-1,4-xylosyltransferase IRX14H [Papaver somniferum]|uniref:probable beta-1,4-xylosyltransferase IRX14H n=1 Tax=Papaver somniferum TaxID=3469 RepID=UPI000E7057C2|nr:probable beta-1,4-xylosyltransferase IRX14H [Papaver somniferum]